MHEGEWSARLGIPGRPAEAESSIVARDLTLARLTGGRYHVLHMSSGQSAALVRAAKADGVRVTAECTPQHLVLTDAACASFDPVFKMNPPLREQADVDALRAALVDGTIDAIATDHAPHAPETKDGALRGSATRHARGRDRARRRAHDARRAGHHFARARARRNVVAAGAASPASTSQARRTDRSRATGAICVCSTRAGLGGRRARAREQVEQLALGRLEAHRQGPPHRARRRLRRCETGALA